MRTIATFITDICKKPPLLFPLVALFHLYLFGYTIWSVHDAPFPAMEWLQFAWILAYTFAWICICDLRIWALWAYLAVTSLDLILRFAISSHALKALYVSSMFPINILLCFFILFYYKKFD